MARTNFRTQTYKRRQHRRNIRKKGKIRQGKGDWRISCGNPRSLLKAWRRRESQPVRWTVSSLGFSLFLAWLGARGTWKREQTLSPYGKKLQISRRGRMQYWKFATKRIWLQNSCTNKDVRTGTWPKQNKETNDAQKNFVKKPFAVFFSFLLKNPVWVKRNHAYYNSTSK